MTRGEHRIGADADEGLLADRDQPGIAGEQVPELRQRQHGQDEEQVLDHAARGEERRGEAGQHDQRRATSERR